MNEKIIRYGENKRGFGIVTLPERQESAPIVILLNAGLLHRSEPYSLNVRVARELAQLGYICVRIDLSGKGDTPARENLINRESVWKDWQALRDLLNQQFGRRALIIFGLCSGADNGIKIAALDAQVAGLILLDPVALRDKNFSRRQFMQRVRNPSKWINLPRNGLRYLKRLVLGSKVPDYIALRDEPTLEDMHACYRGLVARQGRVLAIFTSHELKNYNKMGQYSEALNVDGLAQICEEIFWPRVLHLYPVAEHRERLIIAVRDWAARQLESIRKAGVPD